MKNNTQKIAGIGVLLMIFLVAPHTSQALSCMDPEGMIGNYVSEPTYTIVTATPTLNKEHVKEKAVAGDPNGQYDSGYTAQLLTITKAHKGTAPDTQWVYFERNSTWNYLCVSGPAPLNKEQLYIIQQGSGLFDMPMVAGVYEADSKIAKDILKALADSEEDWGEPSVYETNKAYWLEQLKGQLKDMAFMIEVKLAEWKYWLASK